MERRARALPLGRGGEIAAASFRGRAGALSEPVRPDLADAGLSVVVEQQVSVTGSGVTPTAAVTGSIALDDLRRVFPGY